MQIKIMLSSTKQVTTNASEVVGESGPSFTTSVNPNSVWRNLKKKKVRRPKNNTNTKAHNLVHLPPDLNDLEYAHRNQYPAPQILAQ